MLIKGENQMRRIDKEHFKIIAKAGLMSTYNHIIEDLNADEIKLMIDDVIKRGYSARIEELCLMMLFRALKTVLGRQNAALS